MKYIPALEFAIDPGITGGERIDEILRELSRGEEE
jgi:ribosome-binding factor A